MEREGRLLRRYPIKRKRDGNWRGSVPDAGSFWIRISEKRVCFACRKVWRRRRRVVQERILNLFAPCDLPFMAWSGADKRLPSPEMFHRLAFPLTAYYGCTDEDALAAQAAGVPFVRVERFDREKVTA